MDELSGKVDQNLGRPMDTCAYVLSGTVLRPLRLTKEHPDVTRTLFWLHVRCEGSSPRGLLPAAFAATPVLKR